MSIDADIIGGIFQRLGAALRKPTLLCLIGSTPGIASGQPGRQTPDIDVWIAASDFDTSDLSQACQAAGVLFDPKGEIDPGDIYIQLVRPGIVRLPDDFVPEILGKFDRLTVAMPPPRNIAAAKLVRGSEVDIDDIVWWVRQRGLDAIDVARAVEELPNERDRETAFENMAIVHLVMGREWHDAKQT